MISQIDTSRGTWVFVEGGETGGFKVRIVHDGHDFTYNKNMVFEQALAVSLRAQEILGLPDGNVLVNVRDIINTPDRSRGIDILKKLAIEAGY